MKRIGVILLIALLALTLVACQKEAVKEEAPAERPGPTGEVSDAEIQDLGEDILDIPTIEEIEAELDLSELDSLEEELNFEI